jgi:hypothetical protein
MSCDAGGLLAIIADAREERTRRAQRSSHGEVTCRTLDRLRDLSYCLRELRGSFFQASISNRLQAARRRTDRAGESDDSP